MAAPFAVYAGLDLAKVILATIGISLGLLRDGTAAIAAWAVRTTAPREEDRLPNDGDILALLQRCRVEGWFPRELVGRVAQARGDERVSEAVFGANHRLLALESAPWALLEVIGPVHVARLAQPASSAPTAASKASTASR